MSAYIIVGMERDSAWRVLLLLTDSDLRERRAPGRCT